MTASGDPAAREPLDLLVEEFLRRQRQGEKLDVETFAAAHADHATELRELLPALQALEHVKRDKESTGGSRARVALPAMQRLGDFRIVRELGRGGMGVVFEAVQESLGRKVALKVLPQAALLTGSQLQRFLREAQIAAQLHHSNIVPVFGSGESDGYHWYAMQFIAGESLDQWRKLQAGQPPQGSGAWRSRARFVARIGMQAASALHYAHGQGTLHRDVKPANLLLAADEHLWVTDFGLAKALEDEGLTQSGDMLGTLQYMAPEQFAGHYDARSEVYGLGVTLYELLVLRPAFAAKSRSELMERIRTQRPDALRRLCPEVPEDLAIVVERAMAREPGDRYRDAQALEHDLLAFLEDRPIEARRQSTVGLVRRWCRRNHALAAATAFTLLAVVGAGITGWVAYGITDEALGRASTSAALAEKQSGRAEANLRNALRAFGEVFDALVGPDPMLAIDEDPDTGEQTVIVRTVVDAGNVELLRKMLRFYDDFAAQNAENQALRFETARANWRVGAIYGLLGKPDQLDAAAKAYDQALAHLEAVTDRDVTRALAALHVDCGQLEQRRGNFQAATDRYRQALRLLENEHAPDGRAVRFERAQAHFLLARSAAAPRAQTGRRGAPGSGPGRPPGERPRLDARAAVQTAEELVDSLLGEEPENREFRALKARCLLLSSRLRSRPADGADPGADTAHENEQARAARRQEALDILRSLVAKNPEADLFRFELGEALLDEWRREGPGRGRREDGGGPRQPRPVGDRDLLALREAKGHAAQLVANQPLLLEYQAQRGRAGSLLGRALLQRSEAATEPDKAALRTEAAAELRAALVVELPLVAGDEAADPRFTAQVLETRLALAVLALATGRRSDAIAELRAVVELLERQAALLEKRGGQGAMPPSFGRCEALLRTLDQGDLAQRLRKLRDRFGAADRGRPEVPGPAPTEPRRPGK